MCRAKRRQIEGLGAALAAVALLVASPPTTLSAGEGSRPSATEGVAIGGSVSDSQIINTVNQVDPAVLAAITKIFADQMAAGGEARANADARAADLAGRLGFTTAAVTEFFKTLGERNVSDENVPARLIEIATQFARARVELGPLDPSDPHAADLARQVKRALEAGELTKAETLLEQAKDSERAALREARQLIQKAEQAVDRHALNLAKMESSQGDIALTQLRYVDAAKHYEAAAAEAPPSALGEQSD